MISAFFAIKNVINKMTLLLYIFSQEFEKRLFVQPLTMVQPTISLQNPLLTDFRM